MPVNHCMVALYSTPDSSILKIENGTSSSVQVWLYCIIFNDGSITVSSDQNSNWDESSPLSIINTTLRLGGLLARTCWKNYIKVFLRAVHPDDQGHRYKCPDLTTHFWKEGRIGIMYVLNTMNVEHVAVWSSGRRRQRRMRSFWRTNRLLVVQYNAMMNVSRVLFSCSSSKQMNRLLSFFTEHTHI